MQIYCCKCKTKVEARLTDGKEVYPHRKDLYSIPFWKCDVCGNHVGCHHKTKDRIKPLGCIPTTEIRNARKHIHAILDPLWKSGKYKRGRIYSILTERLGFKYHTAEISSIKQARKVYKVVKEISNLA